MKGKKSLLFLLFSFLAGAAVFGQQSEPPRAGQIAYYSFDNGTFDGRTVIDLSQNMKSNGTIESGSPIYACGIKNQGMELDGQNDFVAFAGQITDHFQANDFTLAFYFRVNDNNRIHDLLSKKASCDLTDPGFTISYNAISRRIVAQFVEGPAKFVEFNTRLNPDRCFYHIAFLKDNDGIRLFVDNELVETQAVERLDIRNTLDEVYLSNGPCLANGFERFSGVIDEFYFYNQALQFSELQTLYDSPDRIITNDTNIIDGGAVDVRVDAACASSFNWSPATAVLDPTNAFTTLSPSTTTTYTLEMNYANCTVMDTLLVNVIDPTAVACGDVPLPNSFTPNGDGLNDVFFISNPFSLQELLAFQIFDRWGNQLFTAATVSDAWDGSFNGSPMPPGPYVYRIRYMCNGQEQEKSGNVLLIR